MPNWRVNDLWGVIVRQFSGKTPHCNIKGSARVSYHVTRLERVEAPVVIVESALDAAVLYQEAGDLIHAVALCSVTIKPDGYLKTLLGYATQVIVCLDYDAAGKEAYGWWREYYPDSVQAFTPFGKDVGEYHLAGHSVRGWIKDLLDNVSRGERVPARPKPEHQVYLASDPDNLQAVIEHFHGLGSPVGAALKTDSTDDGATHDPRGAKARLLALSAGGCSVVVDLEKVSSSTIEGIQRLPLVVYDGLEFSETCRFLGFNPGAVDCLTSQFSTISGEKWGLEKLSQFRLGYGPSLHHADFEQPHMGESEKGAAALEAYTCEEIHALQMEKINRMNLGGAYRLTLEAMPAISDIRVHGLPVDVPKAEALAEELHKRVEVSKEPLPQDDSEALRWVSRLLEHRSPHTGRIHPRVNVNGTVTGRITFQEPNLQGIPRDHRVRELIAAPEGYVLVGADYGQIDLRVAAQVAQDEALNNAFDKGVDIHAYTAAVVFGTDIDTVTPEQRDQAKGANYEIVYGGESKLLKQAQSRLKRAFPALFAWLENQKSKVHTAFSIKTPAGRTIHRELGAGGWVNKLYNYPIQAGSAEVMLAALAKLPQHLSGLEAFLVHCIHDKLILEVTQEQADQARVALEKAMTEGFLDRFPDGPTTGLVEATTGANWADLK
ncbi:DNA polymerase [Oceanidesulfovibrio indonesiensis]|uniref:DNA polymerase n=1 Tax=Oceanidesulfovibrio indonesiensis TaxID=54767 RepID=UPI00142F6631|nr:DNA polymerase [Oceanidesulfovibrio indonesiensis]